MTLKLPLLYFVWTEEYCPNKNKSPNFWHVTSILVCCIFDNKNPIVYLQKSWKLDTLYSDVSIKNIDILPNRQYIAYTADSAQEQYS